MTYYESMFENGEGYQSYVKAVLGMELQIPLDFTDKYGQLRVGETIQGVEVKYDMRFKETGNLWIETAEKSSPEVKEYSPSGVFRNDNTWLYLIGDYDVMFVFGKKTLKRLSSEYAVRENNMKTSKGFLLPRKDAEKYAELIIEEKK